jgi:hypothetical protein
MARRTTAQSALEYLLTYGWAILIIAIVVAVLFYIGIFSGAPRNLASPGACQVVRPSGPGTLPATVSGVCLNDPPTAVAAISPTSNFLVYNSALLGGLQQGAGQSYFAWIYVASLSGSPIIVGYGDRSLGMIVDGPSGNLLAAYNWCGGCFSTTDSGESISTGQWYFVGITYNTTPPTAITYYLGDAKGMLATNTVTPSEAPGDISSQNLYIGGYDGSVIGSFTGYISNVQLYDIALPNATVKELYLEGIGGSPIDPTNLVGWWPLNENSNDSSGNLNTAYGRNPSYKTLWIQATNYAGP